MVVSEGGRKKQRPPHQPGSASRRGLPAGRGRLQAGRRSEFPRAVKSATRRCYKRLSPERRGGFSRVIPSFQCRRMISSVGTEPVTFYRPPVTMRAAKQRRRWLGRRNWAESAKRPGRGCATVGTWPRLMRYCSRRYTPPSGGDAPSKAAHVRPMPEIRTTTLSVPKEARHLPRPATQPTLKTSGRRPTVGYR